MIYEKGIEATEDEINQLLSLLESDYENQKDKNAQNKENSNSENQNTEKLINKINETPGAWFLLPFELLQLPQTIVGGGCIRLLFDSSKQLKLMNLEADYNNHKYLFSLSYEGKKLSEVNFNVSGIDETQTEVLQLKKRFMAAGVNAGKVNWTDSNEIEGSASGLESFYAFGGEV